MLNRIFAKKLKIIYKSGVTLDYTHVTHLCVGVEKDNSYLYITGEISDASGMCKITYDKHQIRDINLMTTEFYVPK